METDGDTRGEADEMRVLVNFLPVSRAGGGLQNVMNLWRLVGTQGEGDAWLAVSRPEQRLETPGPGVDWAHLEVWDVGGFTARLATENVRLPRLAKAWAADVIFTPMGAGPVRTRLPTVIGWHDSTVAYPESAMWGQAGLRVRAYESARQAYARIAGRRATGICVQTETMAERLGRAWGVPSARFRIVPNGPSEFLVGEAPAPDERPAGQRVVLVIGEAKPSKNFEVVPAVADALEDLGVPDVKIVLTLEADGPYMGPFGEALAARRGDAVPIELIGRVPHEELAGLYRHAAAVLLPSLLESFSATYVEAMHFGVPLVTSDLDFAREICGDAALYADPSDPAALAARLRDALDGPGVRGRLRSAGFGRVRRLPDWTTRFGLYRDACRAACLEAVRAA